MTLPLFPVGPSLAWSVHRKPSFSTRIAKHVSGRTVRSPMMANALYGFELTYEVLRADTAHQELQALEGFFLACQGRAGLFLLQEAALTGNPADSQLTGRLLGTGNGSTTSFTFTRPVGAFAEPVGQVETGGLAVYLGGALQGAASYAVVQPNTLVFAGPPAPGLPVAADFTFYHLCAFDEDAQDYENFMYQLWALKSCKLTSVKP